MFFFFFSSRRRHTRLQGDWSSDVCSSDLAVGQRGLAELVELGQAGEIHEKRSEEHTSELQSPCNLVCRLLLEKKKNGEHGQRAVRGDTATGSGQARAALTGCRPCACFFMSAVPLHRPVRFYFFFFNDTATTEIYTLSLHDALPI